ncbi:MAG TPA: HPF/RaiA family ribosome-associated protein [Thermoanaerobaculia bacterium]|nr:HPF/RaiA family ribosome-associated protein [Thermoanaerobaculia bacterium]
MAINVRGYGMHVSRKIRRLVDRRVSFELSRFGGQVKAVTVNLEDLNGPRGGIDKRCSMQANLAPGGMVRVEKTDSELRVAIGRTAARLAHAVARALERRREAPMGSLGDWREREGA